VTANGRIQASFFGASILGPLLADVPLFVMPLPTLLFIDASSFLVSACTLSLIVTRFNVAEKREKKSIRHDVAEGLRYVLHHPVLRTISMIMAMVNFVGSTTYAQVVLFAERQLHLLLQEGLMGKQRAYRTATRTCPACCFSRQSLLPNTIPDILSIPNLGFLCLLGLAEPS